MNCIYSTSQISKLSLILYTFSITDLVASLFLTIKKVVLTNIVKLRLLVLIKIHLMVDVSRVVRYREPVKEHKIDVTNSSP